MPLDVREWTCPECKTLHDRDENASKNIRAEGIRNLRCDPGEVSSPRERAPREKVLGISASAEGAGRTHLKLS